MNDRPLAVPYRRQTLDEAWDAIVIGSGMGGLAAAATLARHAGKRVLVLERHYEPGGFTQVFHRPGYDWDVGLHYVGEVHDPRSGLGRVLDYLTAGRLEWKRMPEVYDRARIGDREYEFTSGRAGFRERMLRDFPGERGVLDRYLDAMDAAGRASLGYFAEKAVPAAVARLAGPLMRRAFQRYAARSTGDVLAGLGASRELAGCLTAQWGDYGLPPARSSFGIHAIVAGHYLEGASYPVGGSARLAEAMGPAIHEGGGQIVTGAEVAGVTLDRRGRVAGVRMADGGEFRAPIAISDAGAANTFERLLPPDAPGLQAIRAQLRDLAPSLAHLCLYVGLRGTSAEIGLSAANLWVHPTPDHDANLARSTADSGAPFGSVFLSSPSAKDPLFERRHPGHATMEVVTAAPWAWFEKWRDTRWKRRGAEYDEWKRAMTERLLAELTRQVPAVAGRVDCAELSTPLSTRHFVNHPHGEIYGLAATPARFQASGLRAATPVRGLYLTGADLAGPGIAGATFGGVLTASAILGRNLVQKLSAAA